MSIDEQVLKLAYKLKLYGIHESFQRISDEATTNNLHPNEFLKLLLEEEEVYRKNRKASTLLSRSKLRQHLDLEDWDGESERGIDKATIKGLCRLDFMHKKHNLIILGATGRGKTHLATAIGKQLCLGGYATQFMPVNFLFEEVMAYRTSGKYLSFIKKLSKLDVLILDDFGLKNYTHADGAFLVDLLECRSRKGVQIITSQVNPKGWKSLFEDPVIADAIIDRVVNPSVQLTIKGGSYREKLT